MLVDKQNNFNHILFNHNDLSILYKILIHLS